MQRCDLTGVSCDGREIIELAGNAPLWVAPTVKFLLMQGLTLKQVVEEQKKFADRMKSLTEEERKELFSGTKIKVY